MPHISAISVGKVKALQVSNQNGNPTVMSGIQKFPVSTLDNSIPISIARLGVEGDEQANLQVHGGIDKAVYAYASEHYEFWKTNLVLHNHFDQQKKLDHGYFGENLTVAGILENEVFIGDNWYINDTILQVTQFREPCFKLNMKMNFKGAAKIMVQSGFSGWYLKVLQEGKIKAGDEITVKPGSRQISIADQNKTFYRLKGQTDLDF